MVSVENEFSEVISVSVEMESLPIFRLLEEIIPVLDAREKIPVMVYPTGSGKSLGIPPMLLKTQSERYQHVWISCITRVAALTLCSTLKKWVGDEYNIGYAAEREIKYDADTQIVYATTAHIFNRICSNQVPKGTCLILDEFHVRSAHTDMSLYVQNAYRNRALDIIMCTATPSSLPKIGIPMEFYPQDYQEFLQDRLPSSLQFLRPHKIDFDYIQGCASIVDPKSADIDRDELFEILDIIYSTLTKDVRIASPGTCTLVFLPGKEEIGYLQDKIEQSHPEWEVLILHGEVDMEDVERVFVKQSADKVRVVLSTNIAETSVTIDGVNFIVDSLLERRAYTSPSGAIKLQLGFISKSSARQRAGRGGRVCDATVVRICTREFFDTMVDEYAPELERIPVHDIVLTCLSNRINPESLFQDDSLDLLRNKTMESRKLLKWLVLVDEDDKPTKRGFSVCHMGIGIYEGTLLAILQERNKLTHVGVSIAALISCFGPYLRFHRSRDPPTVKDREIIEKQRDAHSEWDHDQPLISYLMMWFDCQLELENNLNGLSRFCRENFVQYRKMRELWKTTEHLHDHLNVNYPSVAELKALRKDVHKLKHVFLEHLDVLFSVYAINIMAHVCRERYSSGTKSLLLSTKQVLQSWCHIKPYMLLLQSREIPLRSGRSMEVATLYIKIKQEYLDSKRDDPIYDKVKSFLP